MIYFEDSAASSGGIATEFIFLFAAALACILTSFVASPFETIRVKSMSYIDDKRWNEVFVDFIVSLSFNNITFDECCIMYVINFSNISTLSARTKEGYE